jgi:hypothetical protein
MAKAVLDLVARREGLTLSELQPHLRRSHGAVRDYLGWLLDVDALRQYRKRYYYVDGLLRRWVMLHGAGVPPSQDELRAAAVELLGPPRLPPAGTAGVPRRQPDGDRLVPRSQAPEITRR